MKININSYLNMKDEDPESDLQLKEILMASKAKLANLVNDIQLIKDDTEKNKQILINLEDDKARAEKLTSDLREELENEQTKNKELIEKGNEIRKTIMKSKQDLAVDIEEGERKEKELTIQIKKAQEEQKKIQSQYKELQKTNEKFDKDREKIARLQEALDKKQQEIEKCKQALEESKKKAATRIQKLEEHTKFIKDFTSPSK